MANDKLQDLIDTLKKQGVKSGEKAAQEIIGSARSQAEDMLAQARAEAASIVARAKEESDNQMKRLQSSMEIAASQFINKLKGVVEEHLLSIPLKKELRDELSDPEFMKNLLQRFVASYASGHQREDIQLLLPQQAQEQLKDFAVELMAKHYGQSKTGDKLVLTLEVQDIKFGFQVDMKDGNVRLDFSDDAFLSLFLEFLSPRFRDFFRNIQIGDLAKK